MPSVDPDRPRHRQKRRLLRDVGVDDAQLLGQLTASRLDRVLVRLDVATWRQPQASIDVIDEQHGVGIDKHDVRHEVLRRCRRLDPTKHIIGALQPGEGVGSMRPLTGSEQPSAARSTRRCAPARYRATLPPSPRCRRPQGAR